MLPLADEADEAGASPSGLVPLHDEPSTTNEALVELSADVSEADQAAVHGASCLVKLTKPTRVGSCFSSWWNRNMFHLGM